MSKVTLDEFLAECEQLSPFHLGMAEERPKLISIIRELRWQQCMLRSFILSGEMITDGDEKQMADDILNIINPPTGREE